MLDPERVPERDFLYHVCSGGGFVLEALCHIVTILLVCYMYVFGWPLALLSKLWRD